MVIEEEVLPYLTWLIDGTGATGIEGEGALIRFGVIAISILIATIIIGFLVSLVRYGPVKAGEITYRTLICGTGELFQISPKRIFALAWLAIKEAFRRRVFVSLIIYGLILLFANWFLKSDNADPARIYLNFVLTATNYLVLLIALLLSAFSIPNDMKYKTIYTIVTKPVRAGDIVLGRILGFSMVGTLLLAIMGIGSWIFVNGALSHTHEVDTSTLQTITAQDGTVLGITGKTTVDAYHRHSFDLNADGFGSTVTEAGHRHTITKEGDTYVVGPAEDYIRARVPKRGRIAFVDTKGVRVERGISVGNEWDYRSFIQGASQAAAIWTFSDMSADSLPVDDNGNKYLPVDIIVRVYRSWKGDIDQAIQGSIQLRNPETGVKSAIEVFPALDNQIDSRTFPNELVDTDQNDITIAEDLISSNGEIELFVQCLDRGQYFGFAQADCFIRLPEGSPLWNFVKGHLSIWMQMVIVIAIAVTASTFLSGPIAMIFTVTFLVLGFFRDFFVKIAIGETYGGGPVESYVRMITQMNQISPFSNPDHPAVIFMKSLDGVLMTMMHAISFVLPDLGSYLGRVEYVASGFSIPADALGQDLSVCLGYVFGLAIAGYFSMRSREVAK